MKKFILSLAFAIPLISFGQMSEEQIWENANYQVIKTGAFLYYTDINTTDEAFAPVKFNRIKSNMLNKEGIARVELVKDNKTIRVYHFDYVDLETLKSFVIHETLKIEVTEKVLYLI